MMKLKVFILERSVVTVLFSAAVIMSGVAVLALRQNNLNMVRLREAVYQTDKQRGDVELGLTKSNLYKLSAIGCSLVTCAAA